MGSRAALDVSRAPQADPSRSGATAAFQALVFLLTWCGYASSNLIRKPLSVSKASMGAELRLSITHLGLLDTASLLPYALFQIYAGKLGDRYGARLILAAGLSLCALSTMAVGTLTSLPHIVLALAVCGLGQALCWPACAKALAPWFSDSVRTTVLGLWGTSQAAGGLIGSIFASALVESMGWRSAFFYPSLAVLAVAAAAYLFLLTPQEAGVTAPNARAAAAQLAAAEEAARSATRTAAATARAAARAARAERRAGRARADADDDAAAGAAVLTAPVESDEESELDAAAGMGIGTASRGGSASVAAAAAAAVAAAAAAGGDTTDTNNDDDQDGNSIRMSVLSRPACSSSIAEGGLTSSSRGSAHSGASRVVQVPESASSGSDSDSTDSAVSPATGGSASSNGVTLLEAFQIPMMLHVTICFLALKLARYVFILWLPMYFTSLGYSARVAGLLATAFELGNAVGSAVNGLLIDKCFGGRKIRMVAVMTSALVGCLLAFVANSAQGHVSLSTAYTSAVIMFLAGFCEPGFVLSGPVAAELGEYGGRDAQASLAGIVNGLGGLGAVAQAPLVSFAVDAWGWSGVFYSVAALCAAGAAALVPAIRIEEEELRARAERAAAAGAGAGGSAFAAVATGAGTAGEKTAKVSLLSHSGPALPHARSHFVASSGDDDDETCVLAAV